MAGSDLTTHGLTLATEQDDTPAAREPAPVAATGWREQLFPADESGPASRRALLVGTLVVLAGAAASLLRTGPPGALNSIWAEDGLYFLTDAERMPWYRAIVQPEPGYVLMPARLLTEPASVLPIGWAAAVIAVEAAIVTVLLATFVYVASRGHLPDTLSRLAVAVPAAIPAGYPPNALATTQFTMVYAALWAILWRPSTRRGRILAMVVLAVTAANTILVVTLLPVLAIRLFVRRDRPTLWLGAAMVPGLLLQLTPHLNGLDSRATARWDVLWAGWQFAKWGLPGSVFGIRWTIPVSPNVIDRRGLIVAAWLIVIAIALLALAGLTRPNWALAVLTGGFAVAIGMFQVMAQGDPAERYLVPVSLSLTVALVALLRPTEGGLGVQPLVAFVTLLAVVCAANLRIPTPRDNISPWNEVVRDGRERCAADPALERVEVLTGNQVYQWRATLPCARLR